MVAPYVRTLSVPTERRTPRSSYRLTNPLERLNKEVKRRADVVGIFPNEASITRLIGAVLLKQNDEWLLQCRYMQIEGMAELAPLQIDTDPPKLPPIAA
jgi:transposase-like protein